MHVNFQTQYKSGNERLNAAILNIVVEDKHLVIKFDRTTYDRVEVESTISRHIVRGNQNIIVTLDDEETSMVVEPSPEPYKDDDVIIVSYKILATG